MELSHFLHLKVTDTLRSGPYSQPINVLTGDPAEMMPWLASHAGEFGFSMSYPRGNPHGIVYEPWHWLYAPG